MITKTKSEKEIYNEGVRDALKEIWLYDGVIPDAATRSYMCRKVQEDISYKNFNPLVLVENSQNFSNP